MKCSRKCWQRSVCVCVIFSVLSFLLLPLPIFCLCVYVYRQLLKAHTKEESYAALGENKYKCTCFITIWRYYAMLFFKMVWVRKPQEIKTYKPINKQKFHLCLGGGPSRTSVIHVCGVCGLRREVKVFSITLPTFADATGSSLYSSLLHFLLLQCKFSLYLSERIFIFQVLTSTLISPNLKYKGKEHNKPNCFDTHSQSVGECESCFCTLFT